MKKWMNIILVMGMILCLGGCGDSTPENSMAKIYDDYDKLGSYYSKYDMSSSTQEMKDRQLSGTYEDLNGMVLVWNYEPTDDVVLDIKYWLKVSSGKVKLILVDSHGGMVTLEELSNGVTADMLKAQSFLMQDGLYCLKIVGTEDAVVEFKIQVDEGTFIGVN